MLTVEQIQQHFIEVLNGAIRRPALYGPGEVGLHYAMSNVTYVMETDDEWSDALAERGAWSSIGVSGAVRQLMPETEQRAAASVYADYAREHGWLTLDRVLTSDEYGDLHSELATWCAVDRTRADVLARFGEPSVRIGGIGDQSLGYGRRVSRSCGSTPGTTRVLLAGRCGGQFVESLLFTPEGARRRPAEDDDEE
ncbi:hypothetical protein ACIA49_09435 [Kribbella sp. NPDC051587]|uniref:hypothetical protein n=1 Tax=Kribbella sp. NPDC051587 TaxID=3364119 RepID=UPI00378A9E5E